jgi:hypothetical protein
MACARLRVNVEQYFKLAPEEGISFMKGADIIWLS